MMKSVEVCPVEGDVHALSGIVGKGDAFVGDADAHIFHDEVFCGVGEVDGDGVKEDGTGDFWIVRGVLSPDIVVIYQCFEDWVIRFSNGLIVIACELDKAA